LRKLDNIESSGKEKNEIADLRTRLSNVESESKKHKSRFEELESYSNQIKEVEKNRRPAPVADYIK
jgi:hypothetical protein